tara:strand:- start:585 stop:2114 length:1530 start_codon:yes stop_codon:yes gene_type:complete
LILKLKNLNLYSVVFPFVVIAVSIYCLWKFGINTHFEEWTGRGLYPGLAFAKGFDLYETQKSPLITMYGFGMAFFYSLSGLASHPTTAITIGYLMNLLGLMVPLYFVSRIFYQDPENSTLDSISLPLVTAFLVLFCLQLEKTTSGVFKIHADTPALLFILIGLCFFQLYESKKLNIFLFLTSLSLSLAVWSKLPTLPALFFPFIYLFLNRRLKESFHFLLHASLTLFGLSTLIFWVYGFDDVYYYIIQFPSGSMWSYRNDLFDGSNVLLKRHSYFEGIPLLVRFFVMYLAEYWYFIFSNFVLFLFSFRVNTQLKLIFRCLPLIAILTLPTCLAHLARFGAVENALIFTNSFSVLGIVLLTIYLIHYSVSKELSKIIILSISCLILLPSIRTAKGLPTSTENAPHQQSFDYLESGKKDVYFGWYPISHLLHSGENFTSIEVPIWVGMNQPDKIKFDLSHIPKGAKFLATSPTGYGSTMLKQYIGDLIEVPAPEELSSWRLYEIKALSTAY